MTDIKLWESSLPRQQEENDCEYALRLARRFGPIDQIVELLAHCFELHSEEVTGLAQGTWVISYEQDLDGSTEDERFNRFAALLPHRRTLTA